MVVLTTREERILEKKIRITDHTNTPVHEIIVSDHVFSDPSIESGFITPYRVCIAVPQETWDRLTVGMKIDVQWVVPGV